MQIIFSIIEPDLILFGAKISEFRIGTVISVFFNTLKIQMKENFVPVDEAEEKALL